MARGTDEVSTHGEDAQQVTLQFVNSTQTPIRVLWVDFAGKELEYQTLEKGHSSAQQSYSTHLWRLRTVPDQQLVGSYRGPNSVVEALGPGKVAIRPLNPDFTPDPSWGAWRTRAEACGVPVMGYDCVGQAAVDAACVILRRMLAGCPADVVQRLRDSKACVGIIGRCQVTSDMPGHTHLKLSQGGRDLDKTARGLGGSDGCPLTTCGEENLTMNDDKRYPSENILIHEFAHTVMNLGMTEEQRQAVRHLHETAVKLGLYSPECYALENADEYWAEGSQAWFDATVREDVNGGINTREKLVEHDPGLGAVMQQVYGSNPWRYPQDAPSCFNSHGHPAAPAATTSAPPPVTMTRRDTRGGCGGLAWRLGHAACSGAQHCAQSASCLPQSCWPSGKRRRAGGALKGSGIDEQQQPVRPPEALRKSKAPAGAAGVGPSAGSQGAAGSLLHSWESSDAKHS